ncbi:uncharacterized protein LOC144661039 [Oculina patagonica]
MISATTLQAVVLFGLIQILDGCEHYSVLNETDRAQGHVVMDGNFSCDIGLSPGPKRFQGAAGDRMADKCVPQNHCGTKYPGWLNGSHPSVAEGVVSRKICYSNSTDCCFTFHYADVKNCSGYYIYQIQAVPGCPYRICGNAGAASVTSASSSHISPSPVEFSQTRSTTANTDILLKTSLHLTATWLSNQIQTSLLSTSQTTALNLSATSTQNMSTTSLIKTPSLNPSHATDSHSLHGSSISQVTSASSSHTSPSPVEFSQTRSTSAATGTLSKTSLHLTATWLSNQIQTRLLSTSQTTALNLSATSTQNIPTTSLIKTPSINPLRATNSQSLHGSSVSQESVTSASSSHFSPSPVEFSQTHSTTAATGILSKTSLHLTATWLSNQIQTHLLSTSKTTPLDLSAAPTQNILTTSLIKTPSINPSHATESHPLHGSSVSQGKNSNFLFNSQKYEDLISPYRINTLQGDGCCE